MLVEDNVLYYSSFLPIIYKEIFTLTSSYIQDQHNLALKLRGLRLELFFFQNLLPLQLKRPLKEKIEW